MLIQPPDVPVKDSADTTLVRFCRNKERDDVRPFMDICGRRYGRLVAVRPIKVQSVWRDGMALPLRLRQ